MKKIFFIVFALCVLSFSMLGCEKEDNNNHHVPPNTETGAVIEKDPYEKPWSVEIYAYDYFQFFNHLSFRTTKSMTKTEYPDGKKWRILELEDQTIPEKPKVHIDVNPDGYGPIFADKIWTVAENEEGEVDIINEEIIEKNENNDDEVFLIKTNLLEGKDGNTYFWSFHANEGGRDFEGLFKSVMNSFVLTSGLNEEWQNVKVPKTNK